MKRVNKRLINRLISIILAVSMVIGYMPGLDLVVSASSASQYELLASAGDADVDINDISNEADSEAETVTESNTESADEEGSEETEEETSFDETKKIDDVEIKVSADKGVFPVGAVLAVEKLEKEEQEKVDETVSEERENDKNLAVSYTYDIKVLDTNGTEIQPDTSKGEVKVSFNMEEVKSQNLEADIYHIEEDKDSKTGFTADKLDVEKEDIETISAETDGFSYYTVEFTYNDLQYVLGGEESIPLSDILDTVGLTGNASAVEVSNSDLFEASNESGEWIIASKKAFTTNEWMKVTIDDIVYEIEVTDAVITTIESVADWNAFCDSVAGGETYAGKTVELKADIGPVTRMVGTATTSNANEMHSFNGTFEGNGHVLTVSIDISEETGGLRAGAYAAPFRYTQGATIQNLSVQGTVKGTIHAAGLVGYQYSGRLTMNNINVSTDVLVTTSHCGGLLGHGNHDGNAANTIEMNNCIYSGTISNKKIGGNAGSASIGGLIGWAGGPLDSDNCSFLGHYNAEGAFHPLGVTTSNNTYNDGAAHLTNFHSNTTETVSLGSESFRIYPLTITPDVAKVTNGSQEKFFNYFNDAVSEWTEGSTLTLLTDIKTTSTVTVPSGAHILNLNGYGLNANGGAFSVITVPSGAELTINDNSSTDKTYKYSISQPAANTAGAGLATVNTTGSNSFIGGYITGGKPTSGSGGGICIVGGTVVMTGGTIIGNYAKLGGGVSVDDNGTIGQFTMQGGAIIGNRAGASGGAGVDIVSASNGTDASSYNTFTMSGGEIKYNYTECIVGGGVRSESKAKMILTGGSIINNACGSGGRGAGIGEGWLYLSGSPLIDNNYAGTTERNVNQFTDHFIVIDGALSNSTPIGITAYKDTTNPSGNGTFTASTNTDLNDMSKFVSEMPGYKLNKNVAGQLELVAGDTKVIYPDGTTKIGYFDTMSGSSNWTDGSTLVLLENVTTTTQLALNDDAERTLDLSDKSLTINCSGVGKTLISSGTLNIKGTETGVITTSAETGRIITLTGTDATLNIISGNVVGNPNYDSATIGGDGTITVTGGTVTAPHSNAFSMSGCGILNLYGGNITSTVNSTKLTESSTILTAGDSTINIGGTTGNGPVISSTSGSVICTKSDTTTINISKGTLTATNGYVISGYESDASVKVGSTATININGAPSITGGLGGIYLGSGKKIHITDTLVGSEKIGVTTTDKPTNTTPVIITEGLNNNGSSTQFSSDDTTYKLNSIDTSNGREAALYTAEGAPTTYWDGNVECTKEPYYNTSSWYYMQTTDSSGHVKEPNPMILTFSEDGTKLLKIEIDNYYINSRPVEKGAFVWHGFGFGITERSMPYNYAYLYKDRTKIGMNDPNYLDEAFIVWKFSSNNSYDINTSLSDITINPWEGTTEPKLAHITDIVELSDADNAKFDPETTYYAHFITQGWRGNTDDPAQWGTVQPTPFKISDNPNFRYSADFNYNGHGGTNFTLPMHKGDTVTDSAKTTNAEYDKWTTETKTAVDDWDSSVLSPSAEGYIFGGWYTDSELTTEADFDEVFQSNTTYYAKWTVIQPTKPVLETGNDLTMQYGDEGKNISVSVTEPTADHAITYQWYRGTKADGSDAVLVSGAEAGTYEIPNTTLPGTYYYYCRVTAERNGNGLSETTDSDIISVIVNKRSIYVSGITSEDKEYDGTENATLKLETMVLNGKLPDDDVSIVPTGKFDDKKVGNNKQVNITYSALSGAQADRYTFDVDYSQTVTTEKYKITPAPLSIIGGITASDKVYDKTVDADINADNPTFDGLIAGDVVGVSVSGTFDNANVGNNKVVTLTYLGLTGDDSENYAFNPSTSLETVTASITARSVTVKDIEGTDFTYNGNSQTPTFKIMNGDEELTAGTEYTVTYTGTGSTSYGPSAEVPSDAGTYELKVDFANGNYSYTGGLLPIAFTIGKKTLTNVNNLSVIPKYFDGNTDANIDTANAELVGLVSGDDVSIDSITASYEDANAGTNKTVTVENITLKGSDKNNYVTAFGDIILSGAIIEPKPISKDDVTVSITPSVKTYKGSAITDVTVTVKVGDETLVEGTDYNLSFEDNVNVGEATVTIVTHLGSNYSIATDEGAPTTGFTINPAEVYVVSGITASNKEYDGNTAATLNCSNAVLNGVFGDDDVSVSASGTFDSKNIGTDKAVSIDYEGLTGAGASNYELNIANSQQETTADITKRTLTVAGLEVIPREYDGTTTADINIEGATLPDTVDGDDIYVTGATGTYDTADAGTDKEVTITSVTVEGTDKENYSIDISGNIIKGDITPKRLNKDDVTVDVSPTSKVYQGTPIEDVEVTVTYGSKTLVSGVDYDLSFSDNTNVGNAVVTVVTKDGSNYVFESDENAPTTGFEITKAKITVTGGIKAEDKQYDGTTAATLDFSGANLEGKCGDDDISVTATGVFSDKNVGNDKTVNISGVSLVGDKTDNYELAESGHQTTATASITDKVVVKENPDGSTTTTTTTTDEDGNEIVTEETEKDGRVTKVTETKYDQSGNVVQVTESTTSEDGTTRNVVVKDGDGNVIDTYTEIVSPDSNATKFVKEIGDAPDTTLNNTVDELTGMLLSKDEKNKLDSGEKVAIYLTVEDISDTVDAQSKAKIEAAAAGASHIEYLDINLFKKVGRAKEKKITETDDQIKMTTEIPAEMLEVDSNSERSFVVLRLHEGEVNVIPSEISASGKEISYGSDRFSIFAIVCIDREKKVGFLRDSKPVHKVANKTGDNMPIVPLLAILILSGIGIVVIASKKRRKH